MKAEVSKADAVLEPELRELMFDQDALERIKTAEKFIRWADQLTESVVITCPDLVSQTPPPKVPRSFVMVNLAAGQQDKLRELARLCGVDLRGILRWAIIHTRETLEEKVKLAEMLGVKPQELWRLGHPTNKN